MVFPSSRVLALAVCLTAAVATPTMLAEELRLVKDLGTDTHGSGPLVLAELDGDVVFTAGSVVRHRKQLWKTDCTERGTVLLADVDVASRDTATLDGELYFYAQVFGFEVAERPRAVEIARG